jgi:hypothetical protein
LKSESTKGTLRSLNQAEFLGASTLTQLSTVSPKLTEVYSVLPPAGEGEGPATPDWDLVQGSNAGLVDHANGELRTNTFFYRASKVAVVDLRRSQDLLADELRDDYRAMRLRFESAYEREKLGLVGMGSPPSRNSTGLREQLLDVVESVTDPKVLAQLGEPRSPISAVDFQALAGVFRVKVAKYEQIIKDLKQAEKVRDEALAAQEEAKKRHRRVRTNVARIQEGYYRLAGLDDLADRIRMTIPERSARSAEPEPQPAPEPQPEPQPPAPQPADPSGT